MLPRLVLALTIFSLASAGFAANGSGFTLEQALSYPYPQELAAAPRGSALAWVQDEAGVRNVWMVQDAGATPRQLTHFDADDGQEITQLHFSPDGAYLVFVRGGDHDANWPEPLEPDPDSMPVKPEVQIFSANLKDGSQTLLGAGDHPDIAPDSSKLAFIHLPDQTVWSVSLTGGKAEALFFDRGKASDLTWSPDGKALAFVSDRDDHSFIGIYRDAKTPIEYLAPSTGRDFMPKWSLDGTRVAYVRVPGDGGAPQPILKQVPNPWSIWVADAASGKGQRVWQSPKTLRGSYPDTEGEANLHWLAGDRLMFMTDMDNWPHLYSVSSHGGDIKLLTPGDFMVEHVTVSADGSHVIYSANVGAHEGDQDRRHLYLLNSDGSAGKTLSGGDGIEWTPKLAGDGKTLGFIQAHVQTPPLVMIGTLGKAEWRALDQDRIPVSFPSSGFVTPKSVTFTAADGLVVHGQLFAADGDTRKPAIIFVHGGPPRQMLLGWHYMDYYSNAYAVNQYLASHGFVVLSVNYRLGIGYGFDYMHPDHWGFTGAAEYKDVVAGAKFLMRDPHVNPKHIGIWGGSYGGYLTALALARNSDIFKAGVDYHGVHDWSYDVAEIYTGGRTRYEQGDRKQAEKVAYESSPVASMKTWRSPVLLIQGDDDRNVYFHETIDLANRLQDKGVPYEELVLPNEIHGFLRHASWLQADQATVEYLQRQFHVPAN